MRRTVTSFTIALAATTAAGCGAGGTAGPPGVEASRSPTTARPNPPAPTTARPNPPAPTPTSTSSVPAADSPPAPGTGELPAASDGDDLRSCADGRCEVLVSAQDEIDFSRPVGVEVMRVESIEDGRVTVVGTGPGIMLTLGGQAPGKTSIMNSVAVTVVAVDGDMAVLRLGPR
ncbi:hypothetical protein Misp01_25790 [Microtetraspora sp. NBRC 13810]|uniref:hypothetical protein n=1 Tax=Microtetraspora sp. NBRC 13810 TaxID=3030990 RepID=UPI0024A5DE2D|nr:hypothetical protein [Microtetraspora sp. NBRC 13810]GLW07449.1 hypothetical protein Misp01_25790 [Microtetraspora sp. NBRC 13810]